VEKEQQVNYFSKNLTIKKNGRTSSLPARSDLTKVVVVGGYNGAYLRSVQVLDFASPDKSCASLPPYPLSMCCGTATFYKGELLVCGGEIDGPVPSDKCFKLSPDLTSWVEILPLPNGPREVMSSSQIDGKWLISGGYYVSSQTTSLIYDDGQFIVGPRLPFPMKDHCQLTINSTHVFIGGTAGKAFLLDWPKQEFVFFWKICLPKWRMELVVSYTIQILDRKY
jgi:hypothetical protein